MHGHMGSLAASATKQVFVDEKNNTEIEQKKNSRSAVGRWSQQAGGLLGGRGLVDLAYPHHKWGRWRVEGS